MINHHPRLSIGLPVYNGEKFIKEAIDSVLAQTFEDFELIISDNFSQFPNISKTHLLVTARLC